MKAEEAGQFVGQLLFPFLLLLLVVRVAVRAANAEPRSRRLSGYGLACGLVVLPAAGVIAVVGRPDLRFLYYVFGAVVLVAGVAALVLGVRANEARAADGGTRRSVGSFVGGGFSVFMAVGFITFPLLYRVPEAGGADDTAFAHRVEPHGFQITIPSTSWKPFDGGKRIADFANRVPQMVAGVMAVEPDATGAGFQRHTAIARQAFQRNAAAQKLQTDERGENDHGQPVCVLIADENADGRRIHTGMSVTWVNKAKVVVLCFEGQYANRSQVGQENERAVFEKVAPRFLRSAR